MSTAQATSSTACVRGSSTSARSFATGRSGSAVTALGETSAGPLRRAPPVFARGEDGRGREAEALAEVLRHRAERAKTVAHAALEADARGLGHVAHRHRDLADTEPSVDRRDQEL